jgi:hypothetical protein
MPPGSRTIRRPKNRLKLVHASTVNENDVIHGQGCGSDAYIGNIRYRDIIDEKREEFRSAISYKEKHEIAERVFHAIRSSGGRFLSVASKAPLGSWYVQETDSYSLQKCKRSLGQLKYKRKTPPMPVGLVSGPQPSSVPVKPNTPIQAALVPSPLVDACSDGALERAQVGTAASLPNDMKTQGDDVSDYLSSVLALSGRSTFADEKEAGGKGSTTNKEKANSFRKHCSVPPKKKAKRKIGSVPPKKKKKRKICTGSDDVASLVKQMRVEIEKIPEVEKEALMEAHQKLCRSDEFSDHRLEQFLRCEGMNAKVRCFEHVSSPSEVLYVSIGNSRMILLIFVYMLTAGCSAVLKLLAGSKGRLWRKVSAPLDSERSVARRYCCP